MLPVLRKSQSNWVVIQTRVADSVAAALSWNSRAPIMKTSMVIPETTNTGTFMSSPNIWRLSCPVTGWPLLPFIDFSPCQVRRLFEKVEIVAHVYVEPLVPPVVSVGADVVDSVIDVAVIVSLPADEEVAGA